MLSGAVVVLISSSCSQDPEETVSPSSATTSQEPVEGDGRSERPLPESVGDLHFLASKTGASIDELRSDVIVSQESIFVGEREVTPAAGFEASGSGGEALKAALGDVGESVKLIIDRLQRFSTLVQVTETLRALGVKRVDLIVQRLGEGRPMFGVVPLSLTKQAAESGDLSESPMVLAIVVTDEGTYISASKMLPVECGGEDRDALNQAALNTSVEAWISRKSPPPSATPIPSTDEPTIPVREPPRLCSDSYGPRVRYAPNECTLDMEVLDQCLGWVEELYPGNYDIVLGASATMNLQTYLALVERVRRNLSPTDAPNDLLVTRAPTLSELGVALLEMPPPREPAGNIDTRGASGAVGKQRASVPTIRTGSAATRGSLSKEAIRTTIRSHINQIRFCYERRLAQQPELTGRVSIRFLIDSSGAVTSSRVAGSTIGDRAVDICVARAIQRITFPEPEDGGVVFVTYPFLFQSEEESGTKVPPETSAPTTRQYPGKTP